MRILSWNVNGLRSAAEKGFSAWLFKESPDILCLQETKAHPEQLSPEISSPKAYKTFWNNPARRGYAGVSIYTKNDPVSVKTDFCKGDFDSEGRALIADHGDFILINVYFPNGRMSAERLAYKMEFYRKFLAYVDKIKNRNIVICGDVNTAHAAIDLARPKQNELLSGFLPEERAWMDEFVSHGYIDTFRHFNKDGNNYTYWDYKSAARERNVGWRIDYFFVTEKLLPRLKKAFIMPEVTGSDHCPVGVEIAA